MQTPIQISFRGMEPSDAVEARIRERVERLERIAERITSCHVVVQEPHRHHHKGKLFDIRIQVRIPGEELVVTREGSNNHAYEDVYVALRDAFSAMERKLEDLAGRRSRRSAATAADRAARAPG
jgi:ribosomal subunit interface protein